MEYLTLTAATMKVTPHFAAGMGLCVFMFVYVRTVVVR